MSRPFIAALVLVVGLGPSLGFACRESCLIPSPAHSQCEEMQQQGRPRLVSGESCNAGIWAELVFVAETGRRTAPVTSPEAEAVSPLAVAASPIAAIIPLLPADPSQSDRHRPLVTALRI